MNRRRQPTNRRRWLALLGGLAATGVVATTAVAAWVAPIGPAGAAPARVQAGQIQVEVAPAGPYTSGQPITVRIHASPGRLVHLGGICPDSVDVAQLGDATYRNQTCAQITPVDSTKPPSGAYPADGTGLIELTIRAPLGQATTTVGGGTFPCDPTHPCRVPFTIGTPQGAIDATASLQLTYTAGGDEVTQACGTADPATVVHAASPDRLSRQWVAWTTAECAHQPPATSTSFGDESLALSQFSAGGVDLAYAGTPDTTAGFVPDPARKATYVPVALNGIGAGLLSHENVPSSIPDFPISRALAGFTMTAPELASLLNPDAPDGLTRIGSPLELQFARRNPDYLAKGDNRSFGATGALAGPQATTLYLSRYLAAQAPAQVTYPDNPGKYGDQAGKPFGTFNDFNTLSNSRSLLSLAIGVPSLQKSLFDATGDVTSQDAVGSLRSYPYVADTATLGQIGVDPVAVQAKDGTYVPPTPATLQAAVASMVDTPDGTVEPDPQIATPGAYPLAFVEYAVIPTDPISCDKATPIADWLTWVTTTGQQHLTNGLAAITPDLAQQAADRLAAFRAACTPVATPPPSAAPTAFPPAADPGNGFGNGADLPASGLPDAVGSTPLDGSSPVGLGDGIGPTDGVASPPVADVPTVAANDPLAAQDAANRVEVPAFAGPLGPSMAGPLLAIPFVAGLIAAAAWLSSGKPLRRRRLGAGEGGRP